jgi:hypothetical protein
MKKNMPGLLTRSNAASARFFAVLTFLGAYAAYPNFGLLSAIVIATSGVVLWVLTGDPHNHGAIRRVSGGILWMFLLIMGLGIGAP